jgi:hypothetical protein
MEASMQDKSAPFFKVSLSSKREPIQRKNMWEYYSSSEFEQYCDELTAAAKAFKALKACKEAEACKALEADRSINEDV